MKLFGEFLRKWGFEEISLNINVETFIFKHVSPTNQRL